MRQTKTVFALAASVVLIAGCSEQPTDEEAVERAFQEVNVIEENGLTDVMLNVADPNEAINHFQRTLKSKPDDLATNRGLAISYVRAKRFTEGASAWGKVVSLPGATSEDSVSYADALIRSGDWAKAETVLDNVPPTHESFDRYRLEAMLADANEEWDRADSFYEIAVGLTTKPAGVFNNWGYSKLTRGDFSEAERLFGEAIRQDSTLFTAKNNLVLARSAQRKYTLPVIPMDQTEQAQLLYTMGLSAVKQGDVQTGKGLLEDAVETHPQHFDPAVRALDALQTG